MLIPKEIKLCGLTIEVIVCPTLHKDKGLGGFSDYPGLRIMLAGDVNEQLQEQVLYHEIVHFILFVMGEPELRDNEKFVDVFAHLLHQALK